MSFALIAAVAKNNVIGAKGGLPWYLPEDLKRFKKLTWGKTVLMGRKTFESIIQRLGKPLPGRKNIVVTTNKNFSAPAEVEIFHSPADALKAHSGEEVFVIGGGTIYQQTIDLASRLYITHIHKVVAGDVYFPEINPTRWQKVSEGLHDNFSFAEYARKNEVFAENPKL